MYILSYKLDPVSPWKSREYPELSDAVKGIQDRCLYKAELFSCQKNGYQLLLMTKLDGEIHDLMGVMHK